MVAYHMAAERLARSRWRYARWLVIAPHPDDETLGAGALISDAASRDKLAGLVYLTDGSGSHPHGDDDSRTRLIAVRKQEGIVSLRRLAGLMVKPPVFLGWPDASPAKLCSSMYERALNRLVEICHTRHVDAMAVTAYHEPHCDHGAACGLAYAAAQKAKRPVVVFEYLVWANRMPVERHRALRTAPIPAGKRRDALAAHRSQMTSSNGFGFKIPVKLARMRPDDLLFVRRLSNAA